MLGSPGSILWMRFLDVLEWEFNVTIRCCDLERGKFTVLLNLLLG